MSTREQRGYQMFPVLDIAQVETALRFGSAPERHFAPGEMLYDHGQQGAPSWLVLSGSVDVTRRDGLDREAPIVTFSPGQFTGDISQLAGRPAITRARAGQQGTTARPFDAAHLRALMRGSAEIGETVMRALILRRVELIEEGAAGTIIVGAPDSFRRPELHGAVGLSLPSARGPRIAIGDVRSGSVKRVAAGVGEGAAVVAQIYQALAAQAPSRQEEPVL